MPTMGKAVDAGLVGSAAVVRGVARAGFFSRRFVLGFVVLIVL
jgi:hypothetical protein